MICPVCKEPMPLLSKICPTCGYVHEDDQNHPSATQIVEQLDNILFRIKSLPEPTFMRSMGHLSLIMVPLLTLIIMIMWMMSSAGLFLLLGGVSAIWSVILIIKKLCGRLGNAYSDKQFAELKNEYEYIARTMQREYGKDKDVANLLKQIQAEISSIEDNRKSLTRRNLIIWGVVFAIIIISASAGSFGVKSAVEENLTTLWQQQLEEFKAAGTNDEYDATVRTQLLEEILSADAIAEAESFFAEYCMGLMGDLDCAKKIVQHYLKTNDKAAAEAFINKCKLRYESDIEKLKNLLTE